MGNRLTPKQWIGWGIFALVLWGFLFLINRTSPYTPVALRSLVYALAVGGLLFAVQQLVVPRLRPFSTNMQLLLKFLFYASAIFIGTAIVVLTEVYFFNDRTLSDMASTNVFGILAQLFSAPISGLNIGQIIPDWMVTLFVYGFTLMGLIVIFSLAFSLVDTKWNQFQAEQKLRETRLRLLEMQIKPHFLFNTLNAIVSVVRNDPRKAEKLLIDLSDFLRFNFDFADADRIPLWQEVRFTELYMSLIQSRYPKLKWHIHMDDGCRNTEVPAMLLQPLAENAIQHGWPDRGKYLTVTIDIHRKGQEIFMMVNDDGSGFTIPGTNQFPPVGHSLHNIQERLRLCYGKSGRLTVESKPQNGTTIILQLPER